MSNNAWQDRRTLVTGASGFLGTHICAKLIERGAQVHAVSRNKRNADTLTWHQNSLDNLDEVRALIDAVDPQVVYHLSSLVTGSRAGDLVIPMMHANLASTVHLLEATRERDLHRFVIAGSQEEPNPGEHPTSPYAASKAAATAYLQMYNTIYDLPTVHMRTFMIYGPAQTDVKKLVPYVTLEALAGRTPKIGSGTRKLDWVYADDVAEAYLAAADAPDAVGQSFEIGSGDLHSIADMARALTAACNTGIEPEFGAIQDRAQEIERAAEWQRGEPQLGWQPTTPFADGVAQTVQWYRGAVDRGEIQAAP